MFTLSFYSFYSGVTCGVGQFSGTAASACIDCDPGTFNDQAQSQKCSNCAPGWFKLSKGQSSCVQCPAGYQCSANSQPPAACPAGLQLPQVYPSATYARALRTWCTVTSVAKDSTTNFTVCFTPVYTRYTMQIIRWVVQYVQTVYGASVTLTTLNQQTSTPRPPPSNNSAH